MDLAMSLPFGASTVGSGPGWSVVTWRNVMILYVHGQIDLRFLDAALAGHHAALEFDPNGYGVISLAEPTAKLPPSEVRQRATALRKETQHLLRAQSMVIIGDGFFASAMRSVFTGIFTLAQSRVPMIFVPDVASGTDFVVRRACSRDADASEANRVIDALRGPHAR